MAIQIISVILWFVLIPFCLGLPLAKKVPEKCQNGSMIMVMGYFVIFALFQVIYLPFVVFYNHFDPLVKVYETVIILLALISLLYGIRIWVQQKTKKGLLIAKTEKEEKQTGKGKIKQAYGVFWLIALLLIGFQLYMTVFYQFHDGDDAFYAVTSVITNSTRNMYLYLPYTGESSLLDTRHAFSAAPIFISFLAEVCRIHPIIITHVIYSAAILVLAYMLYKLIGDILLEKEQVPLFLIFISLLQLFGNSTIYTTGTFLLTRTAQGKAFLANIIPTAGILGLLLVWKEMQTAELSNQGAHSKTHKGLLREEYVPWIFLSLVMITAVYTSMLGILLAALLVGGVTVLFAVTKKKIMLLVPCMLSMLPLFFIGLLYLKVIF